jgi:hypothetical protein
METNKEEFEKQLSENSEKLKTCQIERGLKSCLSCPEFEKCEIRNKYVSSVYRSMSKGESADFDF